MKIYGNKNLFIPSFMKIYITCIGALQHRDWKLAGEKLIKQNNNFNFVRARTQFYSFSIPGAYNNCAFATLEALDGNAHRNEIT